MGELVNRYGALAGKNGRSRSGLILLVLCAFCARAASDDAKPEDYVARAREFLRALYPGLDGQLRPVIIGNRLRDTTKVSPDNMNVFFMVLCNLEEPGWSGPPVSKDWCSDPPLSAHFGFDWQTERKELYTLSVRGSAIDGPSEKLTAEIVKNGEWSDDWIAAALNKAGAKFGPNHKADFLRAFPREQLKPFMGGDLEVVSAEFFVEPLPAKWVVQAKWRALDGRESDCTLMFEPFHGYLTDVSLIPAIPKADAKQDKE